MVRFRSMAFGKCVLTFEARDVDIMKRIERIINNQPQCSNCVHFEIGGSFCGYCEHLCNKGHNIEAVDSKYYDIDGKDCEDYIRKQATKKKKNSLFDLWREKQ